MASLPNAVVGVGSLRCPHCNAHKFRNDYFCGKCWHSLPAAVRGKSFSEMLEWFRALGAKDEGDSR